MAVLTIEEIYRDYVVDGVPSSGAFKPNKHDIIDTLKAFFKERLSANRTYYVRPDGNDNNNGRADTPFGAFATLNGAYNAVSKIDFNGFDVVVEVAGGTYPNGPVANVAIPGMKGARSLIFRGNVASPSSVVISAGTSDAVVAQSGGKVAIEGFRLQTASGGARCMNANADGEIQFSNIEFHSCSGPHKETSGGGLINNYGPYQITGNAQSHDHCTIGGVIIVGPYPITLVGTPAFSAYYAGANGACAIQYNGATFIGSATGQKFVCHQTGSIYTGGMGWDYLPGSTAGGCIWGAYDDSSQRFNNGAFATQPNAGGGVVSAAFSDASLGANVAGFFSYANDPNAPIVYSAKSRGGAIGEHGAVLSGDNASERRVTASNGVAFVTGAIERFSLEGGVTGGATAAPMGYRMLLAPDVTTAAAEVFRIDRLGNPYFPKIGTTATAGNAFINSASTPVANQMLRSTSSARYKRDIEPLDIEYSLKLLNEVSPVWFRSAIETDDQTYSHWGFIAEDVASVDPRLVHWGYLDSDWKEVKVKDADGKITVERKLKKGAKKRPDGVQYDRFAPHHHVLLRKLFDVVKEQQVQIDKLVTAQSSPKASR